MVCGKDSIPLAWTSTDNIPRRRIDTTYPIRMLFAWNTATPYACQFGKSTARKALGHAGGGVRKKRRPPCNGADTG